MWIIQVDERKIVVIRAKWKRLFDVLETMSFFISQMLLEVLDLF